MIHFRSLPVIAIRRMLGNWRLLTSVIIGTIVAAATLSSTAIYSDAIRDLGLDFALEQQPVADLDVKVLQSNQGVDRVQYRDSRDRVDGGIAAVLGDAADTLIRMGTSATFYPAPAGSQVDYSDSGRDRAVLRFRSELQQQVDVVIGEFPRSLARAGAEPLPVAIGIETATTSGIEIGQQFDLFPFWDSAARPVTVEVVGIVEALAPSSRYWGDGEEVLDRHTQNWDTFAMLIPETTFFGAMVDMAIGVSADYDTLYTVDLDALNSRNGRDIAFALDSLERRLSGFDSRLHVDTALGDVLETYDEKLFFTQLPLFVLLLQIGGIVAYYLVMVSTMLIERQAAELALLRSRGATTAQLLVQYSIEGVLLAGLAAATGPPLAATVISSLGRTPEFELLSGGGLLEVNISTFAYGLAGAGAMIAFLALMLPAWRATRNTMVELKHASARPRPTPLFMRYYLDVALVLISAVVFWQLSQQEELFTESFFGEMQADPFLLLTPSVFLLTVGIVFLRLFPIVLRLAAAIVGLTGSVAVLVGMRSLVRNPGHYTRLILLLMFATGVGMFGASFRETLTQSYDDRSFYEVGADVRASDLRALTGTGDIAFVDAVNTVPASVASPVSRVGGRISRGANISTVEFMGIDPETFTEVAYSRGDFADHSLEEMTSTLAANSTSLVGAPIPVDARQLGMWIKSPDIRGPVRIGLTLRDAGGRYLNSVFAEVVPNDPTSDEWRFIALDLEDMVERFGPMREQPLIAPLTLHALFAAPQGSIARSAGKLLFGAVLATSEPPLPPAEDADIARPESFRGRTPEVTAAVLATNAFPGATLVKSFESLDGFEVIRDLAAVPAADTATSTSDSPPGYERSTRLQWAGVGFRQPNVRGLQQSTDSAPIVFYLHRTLATQLEVEVDDAVNILVGQKFTTGLVGGIYDLFPTAKISSNGSTLVIANLSRLMAAVNASPAAVAHAPTEVWFSSDDPVATREALEGDHFAAGEVLDIESTRLSQQRDPLVAAGWQGILAIAFGAVLLLSAIGFLVYSYLTAQQRALEFAILRTLGFSRWQVFSLVTFEHLFVIVAGMGLGTAVGLQVGRMMMNFLGTDERGKEVLPPFVLGVSWPSVFFAWGILGTVFVVTIGGVVLLYLRLQVHRALRIGDA